MPCVYHVMEGSIILETYADPQAACAAANALRTAGYPVYVTIECREEEEA